MSAPRHPNHRPLATLPKELRRTTVPLSVRVWVTRTTGLSITTVNRLPGASSTAVHRLGFPDGTSLVLDVETKPGGEAALGARALPEENLAELRDHLFRETRIGA